MALLKKFSKAKATPATVFQVISRWCLRLLVLAVPLVFSTQSTDVIELNKFVLLVWLTVIGAAAWLISTLLDRGWQWQRLSLGPGVVAWVLAVGLATLFSLDRTVSLWGDSGYFHHGLVATVAFALLHVWITQLADRSLVKELVWWFAGSLAAVSVFSLLAVAGVFVLAEEGLRQASFSPVSVSMSLVALLIAIGLVLAISLFRQAADRLMKLVAAALSMLLLVTLIVLDRSLGWYAVIVALLVLLIMSYRQAPALKWGFIFNALLAVAVVALLVPIPNDLVSDISLTADTSWDVTRQTLAERPIVGSGPGTFIDDFTAHRPASFNQSLLWDSRFIKAGNDWWQIAATTGGLGVAAWLLLHILAIRYFWRRLNESKSSALNVGLIAGWVALVVMTFLFPTSFVMWFAWWLLLALAVAAVAEEGSVARSTQTRWRAVAPFLLSLLVLGGVIAMVVTGRLWLADWELARARTAISEVQPLDQVERHLVASIALNDRNPQARFTLAQNKIIEVQVGLTQQSLDQTGAQKLLDEALAEGQAALALSPQRAESYESLIALYQQVNAISGQATGASILALQQQLLALEPNHPRHHADLALSYVSRAEAVRAQETVDETATANIEADLKEALALFEQARSLKGDYATAWLGVIRVKQLQGATDEALKLADEAIARFRTDAGAVYTLGTLYNALGAKDKAEQALALALQLVPEDVTVLLSLGRLLEDQGRTEEAKQYYQRVLAVDAENATAKERLEVLSSGGSE